MNKILFIKIGAIGDVVMAMTAVQRFLKTFSGEFTWLCGKSVAPLIKTYLPSVKTLTVSESSLFKSGTLSALTEVLKVQRVLAGQSYNQVVIGYRDPKYLLLTPPLSFRNQIRFSSRPGVYHADLYYQMLGGSSAELEETPLSPSDLLAKKELGEGLVIAPGGARNILREDFLRRYPIEHYVALAKQALEKNIPVTVLGGPEDDWVRAPFGDLPVNFEIGTIPLSTLPLWLQQFKQLITHDSGPMHLGWMSGIPITALFGPTRADEKVPHPKRRKESIVIQGGKQLSCAPCYDGRNYAECSHQQCLSEIAPHLDKFLIHH